MLLYDVMYYMSSSASSAVFCFSWHFSVGFFGFLALCGAVMVRARDILVWCLRSGCVVLLKATMLLVSGAVYTLVEILFSAS